MVRALLTSILGGVLRIFFRFHLTKKGRRKVVVASLRPWVPFGRHLLVRTLRRVPDEATLRQWKRHRELVAFRIEE